MMTALAFDQNAVMKNILESAENGVAMTDGITNELKVEPLSTEGKRTLEGMSRSFLCDTIFKNKCIAAKLNKIY